MKQFIDEIFRFYPGFYSSQIFRLGHLSDSQTDFRNQPVIFILRNRSKKVRKLYEPWPGWTNVSFDALNTVINTIRYSQTYKIYQKRQMIMNKNTLVWSKLISFIYSTMKYVIFHAIFVIASCILSRWRVIFRYNQIYPPNINVFIVKALKFYANVFWYEYIHF